jgi:hypothetical protein
MNDKLLIEAEKWLAELGVRTKACPTCLMVNRDDIVNLGFLPTPEGSAYELFLGELRNAISKRLYWANKDDEWFYLQAF